MGLELGGLSIRFSWWGDVGGKWGCIVYLGRMDDIGLIIRFKCRSVISRGSQEYYG